MIHPSGGCRFVVLGGLVGRVDLAGAARLELVSGVVQLRPEDAMLGAMLRGWRAQQVARGLREDTIAPRERLVRRFGEFTNEYPWQWSPGHMDEWSLHLTAEEHLAPSTIRGYQCTVRQFSEFLVDARYGWVAACEEAFGPGQHPVAICHEWNTIAHLNDYEGSPEARPFTREEMQRFLDYADEQVERAVKGKRKGALAAYRDATLFKVMYGWGLRRTETSKLDLADWGRNPAAPQFGRYGMLNVRYGKAKKGQPPRRRNVASVMGWAVEAVADYAENIRPRFGCGNHPALWVTERGGRIKPAEINARFADYRDALGLPKALVPHSTRHAYVSHLTEDGVDRRFIQVQVGHECDSSTAVTRQQRLHGHCAAPRAGPGARHGTRREGLTMAARLDYRWHLRQVMATRGMFSTTDLIVPLADRDITLSSSQVYRLVTDRPERLGLKILMALLDILGCTMDDLIEPVPAAGAGRKKKASAGGRAEAGVGELRPRRARITGTAQ
jgi:site-specific recombinase XerD/DNA-binding Xre family transcriptional regulator